MTDEYGSLSPQSVPAPTVLKELFTQLREAEATSLVGITIYELVQ